MRRRIILGLIASFALSGPALSGPQQVTSAKRPLPRGEVPSRQPANALQEFAARYKVGGQSAAVVVDLDTGEVFEGLNPDIAMPPASVTKVVTTLYGIDTLGAGYKFKTRVLATGPTVGGIIQGDLILAGGGDPALDSDELAHLIGDLDAKGVKGLTGKFQYYGGALPYVREIDDGQPIEAAYNPAVSGLNLNFNRVHLKWGEGDLFVSARAERYAPRVASVQIETEDRSGPIYHYEEKGGADYWSLAAPAIRRPGSVWLPVRQPAPYTAEVFRTIARNSDILLPYPERITTLPEARLLATFERRELDLLCRGMLHFSTNLTAEAVGLTASGQRSLTASGAAMGDWAKSRFGTRAARFHDHSGLGDLNRISANDMAQIVAKAGREGRLDGLLRRYFVPGKTKNQPVPETVEVRAKTGTLNYVRGLSGILTGPTGKRLGFAIFSADLEARAKIDGTKARQPGAKRFANRAIALEQAMLRRWISTYAQ